MKRRDITLGEMQGECLRQKGYCDFCDVKLVCATHLHRAPDQIDLSDPPRFTEAQMAFFKWWSERGAVKAVAMNNFEYGSVVVFEDANGRQLGNVQETSILAEVKENGNALDLAELIGKDAT